MGGVDPIRFRTTDALVILGAGSATQLPDVLDDLGIGRPVFFSTPGRKTTVEQLGSSLRRDFVGSYADAALHVPGDRVDSAIFMVREGKADGVVTVGGGSAIGLGKAVSVETGVPVVAIPTTFSGSEVTSIWARMDGDNKKTGRDPRAAPKAIIYDPDLSADLPPSVAGPSGMNAIAHCVEALYAVDRNPLASLQAREAIRLLAEALPVLHDNPPDESARTNAFLGAYFAGSALEMTSMALHHKLCHVLGGSYGLPHAQVHAVLLPHVVAFNAPAARPEMQEVASILGAEDAVVGLRNLNDRLHIPRSLLDIGFKMNQIKDAAARAVQNKYANPRPFDQTDIREVLEAACLGAR